MIIANSSPLSFLTGTEMQAEAEVIDQAVFQLQTHPAGVESLPQQPLVDDEFWAMLNHQLTELKLDDSMQVIENTDISLKFKTVDFESESDLAADWMTDLKAHFSENDLVENIPGQKVIDTSEDIAEIPATLQPIPVVVENSQQANGEKLPPVRQSVSAVPELPATAIENSAIKSAVERPVVAVVPGSIHAAEKGTDNPLASLKQGQPELSNEADLIKPQQMDTEKVQLKHSEQVAGSNLKENFSTLIPQASQVTSQPASASNSVTSPLTSSFQTLQLSAQSTASQWGEALGEKVSLLMNQKLNTAEIRIDPPHLGKLDIQIQIKDESATIIINTQHAQTRDLIESASVRLREFLQESGYSSVDVDVSHKEQSMAQSDMSQQEDNGQGDKENPQQLNDLHDMSGLQQHELSLQIDNGRIDYFA